ncbi:hypothetical protein DF3PA_60134 [Candidatus Defluviicoccus seviourii]|uniref:Uncharacterized protein n=2 Tax=root TaxID=1 RepID=A0A564WGR3_9PROT|nr:hypothetical protein DF3PB_1250001 [uncultured Defluviicoccus sp.]VUX47655.1 hypothetical protein DF3PA_60134 [Candidatus Defluviicoccus seviourii]
MDGRQGASGRRGPEELNLLAPSTEPGVRGVPDLPCRFGGEGPGAGRTVTARPAAERTCAVPPRTPH